PLPRGDLRQRGRPHVPGPQTRVVRGYGLEQQTPAEALTSGRTAAWTTAQGAPTSPGLADRVGPTGRRASGTVSHLRAAARVSQRHPAWRCATARTGCGARGRKPTHARRQGESSQGWGLAGGGPVGARRGEGRGLGGSAGQVCTLRPPRGGWQGLWQAGGRGGAAAQTP